MHGLRSGLATTVAEYRSVSRCAERGSERAAYPASGDISVVHRESSFSPPGRLSTGRCCAVPVS